MINFHEIQTILDKILGAEPAGNHGAFWRGKTRDEFVASKVFGFDLIQVGDPEQSNLVRALKGIAPFGIDVEPRPDGAFMRRMPAGQAPASAQDIDIISGWIEQGCPDESSPALASALIAGPGDDTHVRYWRSIDFFFLPGLASPETEAHVRKLHLPEAFGAWMATNVQGQAANIWPDYMARADVQESFRFVRFHQRRLIADFYDASQDSVLDSLWKFGGNLLPNDPQTQIPPQRTMNSPNDWFFWIPYLEMSLRADDISDLDRHLGRAWQVGIVADGLLRQRLQITDFDPTDPVLDQTVKSAFENAEPGDLIAGMIARARTFFT